MYVDRKRIWCFPLSRAIQRPFAFVCTIFKTAWQQLLLHHRWNDLNVPCVGHHFSLPICYFCRYPFITESSSNSNANRNRAINAVHIAYNNIIHHYCNEFAGGEWKYSHLEASTIVPRWIVIRPHEFWIFRFVMMWWDRADLWFQFKMWKTIYSISANCFLFLFNHKNHTPTNCSIDFHEFMIFGMKKKI